jgi:hypothetical protein
MDKKPDIFEKIGQFITENPKFFGVFILLVGVLMLLGSIFNWDWVFKGHSYNTQKIEGVANMYGRGFARLKWGIGGVVAIILAIICIILL